MDCCSQPGLQPFVPMRQKMLDSTIAQTLLEIVPIDQALGRILASPVISQLAIPPFNNSAMDGYALCYDDLNQPGPHVLQQSQAIFAGDAPKPLEPGTCARIMTGAPMPQRADTVVMQESTQKKVQSGELVISFPDEIHKASHVRLKGSDVSSGDTVLEPGVRLQSVHISQLAVLGIAEVEVYQPLKVAIFSTGDELVPPGKPLEPGQIYDSNRIGIASILHNLGVDIIDLGILPDVQEELRDVISKAAQTADVIVSSGGVSVGEADFTKDILEELGQIEFWKLAIKPGKPFAYGKIGNCDFMGLPGNPVSAFVTFYQLAVPALLKRMGAQHPLPAQMKARLAGARLKKKPGRMDFQRGLFSSNEQGELVVTSSGNQGSAIFTSMVNANCFIVIEQDRGSVEAGEWVTIEPYQWPL